MTKKVAVKLTENFETNLIAIELFLSDAGAVQSYMKLLDEISDTVIPNLEKFPDMGRIFLQKQPKSVEVVNGQKLLRKKLKGAVLHEYLMADYLMLYARNDEVIHLLSIRHHRQLSFDFQSLWINSH